MRAGIPLAICILLASCAISISGQMSYDLPKYHCINEKDPATLSTKEQMEEFVKGPCSPIVMVPGFSSSKLSVSIDCEVFRAAHPDVFEQCGWNTCKAGYFSGSQPDKEYQLWVPTFNSPFSIMDYRGIRSKCFGHLFNLVYDPQTEDPDNMFKDLEGIKVTWFGNTPETFRKTTCGDRGAEDLLNMVFANKLCPACAAFRGLRELAEHLGYQSGLTYQVIPYDFRKPIVTSDSTYKLERSIRLLKHLAGKKIILVTHSMGNLMTLHKLNGLSQAFKDNHIALWTSVTPAFLGSTKSIQTALGGNPDYKFAAGMAFAIDGQRNVIQSHGIVTDALPAFTFQLYKEEKWFQEIIERIRLEHAYRGDDMASINKWRNYLENVDLLYSWFPSPLDTCAPNFIDRPQQCMMRIPDMLRMAVVNLPHGESYYSNYEDLKRLLETHSMKNKFVDNYLSFKNQSGIPWLWNPGVPVALMYVSHIKTPVQLNFKRYPKETTDLGNYYLADSEVNGGGDGTAPNYSTLFAGLKWAYEFECRSHFTTPPHLKKVKTPAKCKSYSKSISYNQQQNFTAYPVKIIELCSQHNQRRIYDTIFDDKMNKLRSNSYIGVKCRCMNGQDTAGNECDHSTILSDPGFINSVARLLDSGDRNPTLKGANFGQISNFHLGKIQGICPQLRSPRNVSTVDSLLERILKMEEVDEQPESPQDSIPDWFLLASY